jgi:hypothetical protein
MGLETRSVCAVSKTLFSGERELSVRDRSIVLVASRTGVFIPERVVRRLGGNHDLPIIGAMNRYAIWRIDAADPVDGAIGDPGRLLSSY